MAPSKLSYFKSYWKLSLREKIWCCFLWPYSGLVRAAILTLPFKVYSKYFGEHKTCHQLAVTVKAEDRTKAKQIGNIVEKLALTTPWQSLCFVQAIMAKTLLNYYRIPHTFHFGVKKNKSQSNPLAAHAWIAVGEDIICGENGHKQHTIVSTYHSPHAKVK